MFIKGCKYRHYNANDLDIYVINAYKFAKYTKLKIRFVYQKSGEIVGDSCRAKIPKENYKDWRLVC